MLSAEEIKTKIKNSRILVVDDLPENTYLLKHILNKELYLHVDTENDSTRVKDLIKSNDYDLLLVDIQMPEVSGIDILRWLKTEDKGEFLPVIVLTSETETSVKINALRSGAKDFIYKPFHFEEVLLRIYNTLELKTLYNESQSENERLEQKVEERTKELRDSHLEILFRLSKAAEFRDNETGYHIIQVGKFSQLLAELAGLDKELSEILLNAAPLHDVGKIGISDTILLKPGKLTPEEFEIMKSHTTMGGEILANHVSPLLIVARKIAISHHEKWDGSGYPAELKGDDIPIEARITSISDVFDALTSDRPYKSAWTYEKAYDFFLNDNGEYFDPHLNKLFIEHYDEFVAIKKLYI